MAENENIQNDDVSAGQPQQDAGTIEADQTAGDNDSAGAAAAAAEDQTDYKAEHAKLQESQKELQAKLTQTAQEAARNKQLLDTIGPYVDYSRLHGGPGANAPAAGSDEEDAEEYVTGKQVKELVGNLSAKFKQELLAQNVRAKYPDVCDNGPNEVIVRHFLEKNTSPFETPEERIKSAVENARDHIKSLKAEGRKEAETERAKTEADAKVKAAAAAKASGLAASGTTSPSTAAETPELTGESYVQQRRARRAQTQTVAP